MKPYRLSFVIIFLTALLAIAIAASLFAGHIALVPSVLWHTITGQGEMLHRFIFVDIRLSRILLAALIGWSYGLAGAAVQGLVRNPLAEPSLLGAANSAALGAVVVIYLGLSSTLSFAVPLAAVSCALASVFILFVIAGRASSSWHLILAGFAISAFAGAGVALALNVSPNVFAALEIAYWLLGSVENRSFSHVILALPFIVVGSVLLLSGGRALNALGLGEENARALGVSLPRLRWSITLGMACVVGASVAVSGVVGFVGLIVPHMARLIVKPNPALLLVPSGLLGALLLVLADTFVRIAPTQSELKLGVITAFLGVPVFLVLLLRHKTLAMSS